MHFLMPQIFASHAQFKDWFHNPLLGMVEGQQEVNKVCTSFLLLLLPRYQTYLMAGQFSDQVCTIMDCLHKLMERGIKYLYTASLLQLCFCLQHLCPSTGSN